jgi:hypothetical protein
MDSEIRDALYDKINENPHIRRRKLLKFADKEFDLEPAKTEKLLRTMRDEGEIDYVLSSYYRGRLKVLYHITDNGRN